MIARTDSYRWLYLHGRQQEAIRTLSRLLALPEHNPDVCVVVAEMEQAVSVEKSNKFKFTFRSVFYEKTESKNPRRLVLCFMIQLFQQFTGINVIAFYGTMRLRD